jgi:tRNA (guanine37-N1)-methyltransferase
MLPAEGQIYAYNSYDIIGNIAIVRLPEQSWKHQKKIADTIMATHGNVKTVFAQVGAVNGKFRTRALKCIGGENQSITTHKESNCSFLVDVKTCYFSPRLLYERMRIAKQVTCGETIMNLFAGVGCFSLVIANHSNPFRVYSIDINPEAVHFMQDNVRINNAYGVVIPLLGDAQKIIKEKLQGVADRVLMPLPEKAFRYLPHALLSLKKTGGLIHYYDFEHAKRGENPVEKVKSKVAEGLNNLDVLFDFHYGRVVRSTGPNLHQVVLDISIKR